MSEDEAGYDGYAGNDGNEVNDHGNTDHGNFFLSSSCITLIR